MIGDGLLALKIGIVVLLASFLPLLGFTYYYYRRGQRQAEVERVIGKLGMGLERPQQSWQKQLYSMELSGRHLFVAVAFSTVIALLGLGTLFLGFEAGLAESPTLLLGGVRVSEPLGNGLVRFQQGALLVFGMAFLGAYLWAVQNVFRRYAMNDLVPGAFYGLALRMVLASMIAVLIYHGADAVTGGVEVIVQPPGEGAASEPTSTAEIRQSQRHGGATTTIMPVLAFLIGMFPQRGLKWLRSRFSVVARETDPSVRALPLEMIEGMTLYDRVRMEELGIDTCYDLSQTDFIPLMFKTSYGARELIDWLLQAKLCVQFGPGVRVLREHGIRTILMLERLDDQAIEELARGTSLTVFNLKQTREAVQSDRDIARLRVAGELLSRFWDREDDDLPPGARPDTGARPSG